MKYQTRNEGKKDMTMTKEEKSKGQAKRKMAINKVISDVSL